MGVSQLKIPVVFRGNIGAIQMLRGISILLVVLGHLVSLPGFPLSKKVISYARLMSTYGVYFFFIISAFLITGLLLKEMVENSERRMENGELRMMSTKVNLRAFYWRRFLRIFPAFYCFLIVVWILSSIGIGQHIDGKQFIPPALYFTNFAGVGTTGEYLYHTWTLSVEEQFYILWPSLLLLFLPRLGWKVFVSLLALHLVVRLVVIQNPTLTNAMLLPFIDYLPFLAFGALLAISAFRNEERLKRFAQKIDHRLSIPLIILGFGLKIFLEGRASLSPLINPLGNILTGFFLALIIMVLLFADIRFKNGPVERALKFVGMISYSLYLWQQLFLAPIATGFFKGGLKVLNTTPVNVIMSFVMAIISYYFIERYFLRFKRRKIFVTVPNRQWTIDN